MNKNTPEYKAYLYIKSHTPAKERLAREIDELEMLCNDLEDLKLRIKLTIGVIKETEAEINDDR